MSDKKFDCAQCGKEHEGDWRTTMAECRDCRKLHCKSCLDQNYLCNACATKKE